MQYSAQVEALIFMAGGQKMNHARQQSNPRKPATGLPAIPPAPATKNVALLLDVPS